MNDENPAPVDETDRPAETAVQEPTAPKRNPLVATGGRPMSIIPHSFEEAFRIGKAAVVGKWTPFGWSAEMATLAIMHGAEVGLPPMMSLQKIAVINGRPSLWGDAVPAIALATHQLEDWEEGFTGSLQDGTLEAFCRVKRRGIKTTHVVTFSVEDAKRAGLWQTEALVTKDVWEGFGQNRRKVKKDNQPNDSPWYRHPKRMLQMRARRAFRDLFADAFSGLYLAEELIGEPEMRDVTPVADQNHEADDDRVDNPLGGDDEAAAPVASGTVIIIDGKPPAGTIVTPTEPAGKPKRQRAAKTPAAPNDAQAASQDAPEADVVNAAHPDDIKVPPPATIARWGGADYVAFMSQWCALAVSYKGEGFLLETYVRDRHKREMAVRNTLGTLLTTAERERMNDIARAASKGQEW